MKTRDKFTQAFEAIIPAYQEARNRSGSGLQAMAYHQEVGAGSATYTRSTSTVRPCFSDFVADVELAARAALSPSELRYFRIYYVENEGQIDEVASKDRAIDAVVRLKVGQKFLGRKIAPLTEYMKGVDVRDRQHG